MDNSSCLVDSSILETLGDFDFSAVLVVPLVGAEERDAFDSFRLVGSLCFNSFPLFESLGGLIVSFLVKDVAFDGVCLLDFSF